MHCNCCGRRLNPANAITRSVSSVTSGGLSWAKTVHYGPVCGVRLGIVNAPKKRLKPVYRAGAAVRVDDGQIALFEGDML